MSGGEIAALIAAGAFLMLVLVLAVPILRLRHTVDAATQGVNDLNDRTGPILGNVNTTVENVNTGADPGAHVAGRGQPAAGPHRHHHRPCRPGDAPTSPTWPPW